MSRIQVLQKIIKKILKKLKNLYRTTNQNIDALLDIDENMSNKFKKHDLIEHHIDLNRLKV